MDNKTNKPTYEELEAQVKQLAAENAALKEKGREVLKEAAYVYSHYNRMVEHLDGECIDGQTLHEFQALTEVETPATEAFLSRLRNEAAEPLVSALRVIANSEQTDGDTVVCDFYTLVSVAAGALSQHFARQLREGKAGEVASD